MMDTGEITGNALPVVVGYHTAVNGYKMATCANQMATGEITVNALPAVVGYHGYIFVGNLIQR